MLTSSLTLSAQEITGTLHADQGTQKINKEIYGQFAEHLGTCIYGGLWVGENSPIPNTKGYRNDVFNALKELQIPVLRWPGGCFADEYHWMDGIGPREKRPKMQNNNWGGTIEDNSFGTHEFLNLCEMLGTEPYISGNVGSGTVEELAKWVEYMTTNTMHRNISGYSPTRWCSVAACLTSFCEHLEHVKLFQATEKRDAQPKFTDEDVKLVEDVLDFMARFEEANKMLMKADQEEGLATVFEVVNAMYCILRRKTDGLFADACQLAANEIQQRFFNLESKACCKLIFAGILNVRHSIPKWMNEQLELLSGLLVSELELYTGSTPPMSPRDCYDERYTEKRSLVDAIEGSVPGSERSDVAVEEVSDFLRSRSSFSHQTFTAFWTSCQRFRHVKMLAMSLRSIPTNTVWIEQAFSRARRILTWNRMKMSPATESKLWLLNVNMSLTERVMGFQTSTPVDAVGDVEEDIIEDEDLWCDE